MTGGVPVRSRQVILGGRRLGYVEAGRGPHTILLVHGLGASSDAWQHNLAALARQHHVIAVDLPGFGRSQGLKRPMAITDLARTLRDLLDRVGVDRAIVVGHSLGGLISQQFASSYPQRVSALILVASGAGRVSRKTDLLFRAVVLSSRSLRRAPRPLLRAGVASALAITPLRRRLVARAVHDPSLVDQRAAAELMVSALASPGMGPAIRAGLRADTESHLREITCPVLIIGGDQDRLVPPAASARLARLLPEAQHQTWPHVGHHPMWESPALFATSVRDFLADRLPLDEASA